MNNQSKSHDAYNNTAQAQRQRLKKQITEQGSCTTIYAREVLHIQSPASRILELKQIENMNIDKIMVIDETAQGSKHMVAKYFLVANND